MIGFNLDVIIHKFLEMTWYNPIFMIVAITSIWFVPGLVLRSILERRYKASKAAVQANKIARLYPKKVDD